MTGNQVREARRIDRQACLPDVTVLFRPRKVPTRAQCIERLQRFAQALRPWGPEFIGWDLDTSVEVGLHNGAAGDRASTLTCSSGIEPRPWSVHLRPGDAPPIEWPQACHAVAVAARLWPAALVTAGPAGYVAKKMFRDRPGAGWMIYLPVALGPMDVPQAAVLVPVHDDEARRLGTVLVSRSDGMFNDDDDDHVATAHAIELRLVELDLLPRYDAL